MSPSGCAGWLPSQIVWISSPGASLTVRQLLSPSPVFHQTRRPFVLDIMLHWWHRIVRKLVPRIRAGLNENRKDLRSYYRVGFSKIEKPLGVSPRLGLEPRDRADRRASKQGQLGDNWGGFSYNARPLRILALPLTKRSKRELMTDRPVRLLRCGLVRFVGFRISHNWIIVGAWNSQHNDALEARAEAPVANRTYIATGRAPSTENGEIPPLDDLVSHMK